MALYINKYKFFRLAAMVESREQVTEECIIGSEGREEEQGEEPVGRRVWATLKELDVACFMPLREGRGC